MGNLQPSPIETVTIEHPDTPGARMIINRSDFDPAIHKLFEASEPDGAGEDSSAPKEEGGSDQTPKTRGRKKTEG